MTDIVLVSLADARQFHDGIATEIEPLVAAFARRGTPVRVAGWDDPSFDWSHTGLAVLRSTWNYHRHLERFLAWALR